MTDHVYFRSRCSLVTPLPPGEVTLPLQGVLDTPHPLGGLSPVDTRLQVEWVIPLPLDTPLLPVAVPILPRPRLDSKVINLKW